MAQHRKAVSSGGPAAAPAQGFDQALASADATSGPVATAASVPTAASGTLGGGSPSQFDDLIQASAAKYGLDPAVLKGLIRQESGFNPNAGSPAGAQGLTQLMPGTAASLGVTDVHDPAQAIDGGLFTTRVELGLENSLAGLQHQHASRRPADDAKQLRFGVDQLGVVIRREDIVALDPRRRG